MSRLHCLLCYSFLLLALLAPLVTWAAPQGYHATPLEGTVVDAKNGKPVPNVVVSVSYALQRDAAEASVIGDAATRLRIVHTTTDDKGRFQIVPWAERSGLYRPRGWVLVPGLDPELRLYAEGYKHLALKNVQTVAKPPQPLNGNDDELRKHFWAKKTFRLTALASTAEAKANELREWRAEIEADYAGYLWRGNGSAISSQEPLLRLFHRLCKKLPNETKAAVCFPADSEIGQYLARGESKGDEGPRPGRKSPKVNALLPSSEVRSIPLREQ